jgi:hypothetical protein
MSKSLNTKLSAIDNWMRENKRINDEYYCYARYSQQIIAHINNINNRNYLLKCNDDAYKLAKTMSTMSMNNN